MAKFSKTRSFWKELVLMASAFVCVGGMTGAAIWAMEIGKRGESTTLAWTIFGIATAALFGAIVIAAVTWHDRDTVRQPDVA